MSESSNLRFTENGVEQTFESRFVYADTFQSGGYWTWGAAYSGAVPIFGDANYGGAKSTPITTFAGGVNWKEVASAWYAGHGIKQDGSLWSWGRDSTGVGSGSAQQTIRTIPTEVTGGPWKKISAAEKHAYAIKTDGSLWQWGKTLLADNVVPTYGVSGDTVTEYKIQYLPEEIYGGGNNWKQVSAGSIHSAAIKTDGTLWVWGYNRGGQLGTNDRVDRWTPVTTFAGGTDWKSVSATKNLLTAMPDAGDGFISSNNFVLGKAYSPDSSTFAIKNDGTLWSWGSNYYGELGTGISGYETKDAFTKTPILVSSNTDWKSVGGPQVGINSRSIFNWGDKWDSGVNESYSLLYVVENRHHYISSPVTTFAGENDWQLCRQVDRGGYLFNSINDVQNMDNKSQVRLAIDKFGKLYLWGDRAAYNIDIGGNVDRLSIPTNPISWGESWKQVEVSQTNSGNTFIGTKTDGTLWTWGNNSEGLLGKNTQYGFNISTPVTTFAGGTNWKQCSIGPEHAAAVKTDGTLWIWGKNNFGSLGINDSSFFANYRLTPVTTFAGGTDWKQVAVLENNTVAIKNDGTLWTWGFRNLYLGANSSNLGVATPITTFAGGNDWDYVDVGLYHILATKTDGTLWTWGYSFDGATSHTVDLSKPTQINNPNGLTWRTLDDQKMIHSDALLGTLGESAAIKKDGTLWSWGSNSSGQYGANTYYPLGNGYITPVTTFAGGTNWKQISSNIFSTAAIKTDGTLWTWGYNEQGQLGINVSIGNRATPVTTFSGSLGWRQVSCGPNHMVGIREDGTLWTWGRNIEGQLGTNDNITRSTPVTTFVGGSDWKRVTCGRDRNFALKNNGQLWGWGKTGNGIYPLAEGDRSTPTTLFSGSTRWRNVFTHPNANHVYAIAQDGTLWGWGDSYYGKLGTYWAIDATPSSSTPITTFAGGNNWRCVAPAQDHTVAVKTDGTLWAWGRNHQGMLGTNDTATRYTPVTTFAGGTDWELCFAGGSSFNSVGGFTYATKTDGTLWVWGSNTADQLASSDAGTRTLTPVQTIYANNTWYNSQYVPPAISARFKASNAISSDGQLWAWGHNGAGELGVNISDTHVGKLTPTQVEFGGSNWRKVYAGANAVGAIAKNGQMYFWGRNGWNYYQDPAQLWNVLPLNYPNTGTGYLVNTPAEVFGGGSNWRDVKLGGHCNIATKSDGTLWTWGQKHLGNLSAEGSATPVTTFKGGTDWKKFDISLEHSAAIEDVESFSNFTSGPVGQAEYTSEGTYYWTAPSGVTSVCVVCVGPGGNGGSNSGGGGGGGLGWKNNITVVPGQTYTVVVGTKATGSGGQGTASYFISTQTVSGSAGNNGTNSSAVAGGGYTGDGGGNGGQGGNPNSYAGGGGGAGGYSGAGGAGGIGASGSTRGTGSDGSGGGGGGGAGSNHEGGAGGGVGIYGEGTSGSGSTTNQKHPSLALYYGHSGSGGSGGTPSTNNTIAVGTYGGGDGGGTGVGNGGGAVRIIWGPGRAFPSTNTQDM